MSCESVNSKKLEAYVSLSEVALTSVIVYSAEIISRKSAHQKISVTKQPLSLLCVSESCHHHHLTTFMFLVPARISCYKHTSQSPLWLRAP